MKESKKKEHKIIVSSKYTIYALVLVIILITMLIGKFMSYIGVLSTTTSLNIEALYSIYIPLLYIIGIVASARRMRDINPERGTWILIFLLIPFINIFFISYLLFKKSDKFESKEKNILFIILKLIIIFLVFISIFFIYTNKYIINHINSISINSDLKNTK